MLKVWIPACPYNIRPGVYTHILYIIGLSLFKPHTHKLMQKQSLTEIHFQTDKLQRSRWRVSIYLDDTLMLARAGIYRSVRPSVCPFVRPSVRLHKYVSCLTGADVQDGRQKSPDVPFVITKNAERQCRQHHQQTSHNDGRRLPDPSWAENKGK